MDGINLHLGAVALLLLSGIAALLTAGSRRWPTRLGAGGALLSCGIGLFAALRGLTRPDALLLKLPWHVPFGAFSVGSDALTCCFLIPIFGLGAVTALYGSAYMRAHQGRTALALHWFFFDLLLAAMAMVTLARSALLFLVAWEIMSLAPYFLVTFESERRRVRAAGWIYLVAAHLGTAFLLALFVLLGQRAGSFEFADMLAAGGARGAASGLFFLALVGFGTKAGFMPLHVWLPEAHPAAPSHVSALMSGALIKLGIYGLLRTLTFLGSGPSWWGTLLIGVGLLSGMGGIVFAIAQRDLKRLLAYSSVENVGIIALGIGLGLLGLERGASALALLGFAGALLHVLNHAAFKGLLFLGAGSVLHATGSVDLERLGGLLKPMPRTALAFLVGAVAICGLPPLNGFASEYLIYLAAASGGVWLKAGALLATASVIAGLAAIGGLAAACFAKAFGIAFLGEPRHALPGRAHDPARAMQWAMGSLVLVCAGIALAPGAILTGLSAAVAVMAKVTPSLARTGLQGAAQGLTRVTAVSLAFLAVVLVLALARRALLRRRPVAVGPTWDCGFARPDPRMQYTATSFAQPLTTILRTLLRTRQRLTAPRGFFPERAAAASETPDVSTHYVYRPLFGGVAAGLSRMRWLQHGNLHVYVLYIALTLVVLLLWKL